MTEAGWISLFALSGMVLVFIFVALGGLYLLFSYGLYKLAYRAGVEHSWLAFIPIVQCYVLGKLLREIKIFGFVIPHMEWVLLLTPIVYGFLTQIPYVNMVVGILYFIFYVVVTYTLFHRYSDSAVLMTVLGFFLPFLYSIFVFAIRNNTPIHRNS